MARVSLEQLARCLWNLRIRAAKKCRSSRIEIIKALRANNNDNNNNNNGPSSRVMEGGRAKAKEGCGAETFRSGENLWRADRMSSTLQ